MGNCIYGNCNDANCAAGSDTDVNGNPCDDAACAPCGSVAVTGGVAATTVAPNPSINSVGSNPNSLTQAFSTLGQWGATITSIAAGQPTVSGPGGVRSGAAALTPSQYLTGSGGGSMLLIIAVIVVVVVLVANK